MFVLKRPPCGEEVGESEYKEEREEREGETIGGIMSNPIGSSSVWPPKLGWASKNTVDNEDPSSKSPMVRERMFNRGGKTQRDIDKNNSNNRII